MNEYFGEVKIFDENSLVRILHNHQITATAMIASMISI